MGFVKMVDYYTNNKQKPSFFTGSIIPKKKQTNDGEHLTF